MELEIIRNTFTDKSSIGDWSVNGERKCFSLEDTDRGLDSAMDFEQLEKQKQHGKTAIPYGRYEVIINMSNRFKVLMPLLLNVPGYAGVRIHPGNKAEDTEGCLLPGMTKDINFVGSSRGAYLIIYRLIESALNRNEKVFITIKKSGL